MNNIVHTRSSWKTTTDNCKIQTHILRHLHPFHTSPESSIVLPLSLFHTPTYAHTHTHTHTHIHTHTHTHHTRNNWTLVVFVLSVSRFRQKCAPCASRNSSTYIYRRARAPPCVSPEDAASPPRAVCISTRNFCASEEYAQKNSELGSKSWGESSSRGGGGTNCCGVQVFFMREGGGGCREDVARGIRIS